MTNLQNTMMPQWIPGAKTHPTFITSVMTCAQNIVWKGPSHSAMNPPGSEVITYPQK